MSQEPLSCACKPSGLPALRSPYLQAYKYSYEPTTLATPSLSSLHHLLSLRIFLALGRHSNPLSASWFLASQSKFGPRLLVRDCNDIGTHVCMWRQTGLLTIF